MERTGSSRHSLLDSKDRSKNGAGARAVLSSFSREFEDPSRLTPEEYLNKYGLTSYFQDVMTLVLENRPQDPLEFITEYYRNCAEGSSYLHRSYRYIRLTEQSQDVFMDNMYMAYKSLSRRKGSIGTTGQELTKLLSLLCHDFPSDVSASILRRLGKRDSDVVSFEEFALATKTCLLYEDFFELSDSIFSMAAQSEEGEQALPVESSGSRNAADPYPDLVHSSATQHKVTATERMKQINLVLKAKNATDQAAAGQTLFQTRVNAQQFAQLLKETISLAEEYHAAEGAHSPAMPNLTILENKILDAASSHPLGNISLQEFARCVFEMTKVDAKSNSVGGPLLASNK